jgi:N-acyl homoserine lactone hydrolase
MVNATIDVIDRGGLECDLNYLIEGNMLGSHDEPNPDTNYVEIPVFNLVIDHPEGTILWDTGNHKDALDGHWPEGLKQAFYPHDVREHSLVDDLGDAGYGIEDIDYVFQTHLHLDHAGGLHHFDGTDTPVFVHEEELKFAYYSTKTDEGSSAYILGDFDHDLNWQVIHQNRETHFEDVEFVHLPGHTPGLTGTVIHLDGAGTLAFTGDEIYEDETPLGAGLLWSHRHWFDSLQKLKEIERKHEATVVYGHDPDQFETIQEGWS